MPKPVEVYPDPDTNTEGYVPTNTATAAASIASGLISAGAAAAGTGAAVETVAFLQSTYGSSGSVANLISAVPIQYVAVSIVFGLLSVGLASWNLVQGYRMKLRLKKLSGDVSAKCRDLIEEHVKKAAQEAA